MKHEANRFAKLKYILIYYKLPIGEAGSKA